MKAANTICVKRLLASCTAIACATAAFGQTTNDEEDDVFELSPFVVDGSNDTGYRATSTLAGSRLNSSLKDVASMVSVFTEELISDLGATSTIDIVNYANNAVEGFDDLNPDPNQQERLGREAQQFRVRGFAASQARNYFLWETNTDYYNIGRTDASSGPNSILFGIGSPGGIVNTTTKQAVFGDAPTRLELQFNNWNKIRAHIDTNKVLIDDKLAVRVNLLHEDGDSWQYHAFKRQKRAHLASTYRVNERMTIRAEGEKAEIDDNLARTYTFIDHASGWRAAGEPAYGSDEVAPLLRTEWGDHLIYDDALGVAYNTRGQQYIGNTGDPNLFWTHIDYSNPDNLTRFPMKSNPEGPGAKRHADIETYSAYLDLKLSERTYAEFAYNKQETAFRNYDNQRAHWSLFADVEPMLPFGDQPNPNAGLHYIEGNWQGYIRDTENEFFRATFSHELQTERLGRHRFAALYQKHYRTFDEDRVHEFWVDEDGNAPNGGQVNGWSNLVLRRAYQQPGMSAKDFHITSWEESINGVVDQVSGKTLYTEWMPNNASRNNNSDSDTDTYMISMQNFFFDEKLVTTVGVRKDERFAEKIDSIQLANGAWQLDPTKIIEQDISATTRTFGAVYHLNEKLSLFANKSSNAGIPDVDAFIYDNQFAPLTEGEGVDAGIKFDLFDGKFSVIGSYYKTDMINDTFGFAWDWQNKKKEVLATFAADEITIVNPDWSTTTVEGNWVSQEELAVANAEWATVSLQDRSSEGYELRAVGNISKGWNIFMNFSITDVVLENRFKLDRDLVVGDRQYWEDIIVQNGYTNDQVRMKSWGTFTDQMFWYDKSLDGALSLEGAASTGFRKHKGNVYSTYRFSEGRLKGFKFGGGARYQSANLIRVESDPAIANFGGEVYGEDVFKVDLLLGYDGNLKLFGNETWFSAQLNAINALDDDTIQIYESRPQTEIPQKVGLPTPPEYRFTLKFDF